MLSITGTEDGDTESNPGPRDPLNLKLNRLDQQLKNSERNETTDEQYQDLLTNNDNATKEMNTTRTNLETDTPLLRAFCENLDNTDILIIPEAHWQPEAEFNFLTDWIAFNSPRKIWSQTENKIYLP